MRGLEETKNRVLAVTTRIDASRWFGLVGDERTSRFLEIFRFYPTATKS